MKINEVTCGGQGLEFLGENVKLKELIAAERQKKNERNRHIQRVANELTDCGFEFEIKSNLIKLCGVYYDPIVIRADDTGSYQWGFTTIKTDRCSFEELLQQIAPFLVGRES